MSTSSSNKPFIYYSETEMLCLDRRSITTSSPLVSTTETTFSGKYVSKKLLIAAYINSQGEVESLFIILSITHWLGFLISSTRVSRVDGSTREYNYHSRTIVYKCSYIKIEELFWNNSLAPPIK